ncbi:putative phosphatase [Aciduliprofundum sp. MAR08-339]|uniref:HAD family hydrolase n=1 Tax=Aciduliprofundum sp. (strain MAR08-339) TaxID=673860 RepID=UPI0002A4920C|nr:putative phosphatase [Aciduliprofundum sp. MAR08-339]
MLKLVIFDLDQTLLNTLPRFYRIFNMALEHFHARTIDWDTFIEDYAKDTLNRHVPVEPKEFWDYFLSHYNDMVCEKDEPIDGALDVLKTLKDMGLKVVITTGRMVPSEEVWAELHRFGMADYVDLILTRLNNYGDGRRRTELIREAMKKFNAGKEETVLVADYWPDMQSGREVGIFTIGVLTGLEDEKKLKENGADVVIESVKELPEIIRDLL